jgi:hypothetical protein
MKVIVPQELKADVPQTAFGKILSATPVVMAVVATMLAGLASSEMTKAQYDRSLGAQQQSKAGDQWSFFQAKRLRGAVQQNSVELLESMTQLRPLDPAALRSTADQWPAQIDPTEAAKIKADLAAVMDSAAGQQALTLLKQRRVPGTTEAAAPDPRVKAALDAMENLKPDAEMASLLAQVENKMIDDALAAAQERVQAFGLATTPVNAAIDQIDNLLGRRTALLQEKRAQAAGDTDASPTAPALSRDFKVARLSYAALRYEVEARLNQSIANLYELQVRKSNISAERHHARSQRFFFGMLGAQLGVIISTFALAARNRNLLWSLAAGAGLVAVAFALYVYLFS